MEQTTPNPKDKWIPRYFIIFFVVLAIIDGTFVYIAVSTQTGVVTEHSYKKGLAFNEILNKARTQPALQHKASYKDGVLRWTLTKENNTPLTNATVSAKIIRPVQDGYDFDITFKHKGNGHYETTPATPLPGAWTAKLNATWSNKQFQANHKFIAN